MSDNDVFSSEGDDTSSPNENAFSGSAVDLLASIKKEDGTPKYKTVDEALKALAHSQAFIPTLLSEKQTLEQELSSLREQATKVSNIEEVLKKLTANTDPKEETPPAGGLSAEQVAELVRKELAGQKTLTTQQANADMVQTTLTSKFGKEKVKEVVARKAAELNTTPEALGSLALSNPKLVLTLFEASGVSGVKPTTSSVNLPNGVRQSELAKPEKSLLLGATSRDQKDYMMKVKEAVYKRHNVET